MKSLYRPYFYLWRYHITASLLVLTFGLLSSFRANAQKPVIASFTPTEICQGNVVTISGTNFKDANSVKIDNVDVTNFTVKDDNTITATVPYNATTGKISVSTPAGTDISTNDLTVNMAPIPSLDDISAVDLPFTNCNGNNSYQLIVQNSSKQVAAGSNFTIDWGDNSPPFTQINWPSGAQTNHTYASQGYFTINFTITPPNGCTKKVPIKFYNGANPLASLTTTKPTTGLCAPAGVDFEIGNWSNNSAGTTYHLDFGDNTPELVLPHPLNATNINEIVNHVYTKSSCPSTDFKATLNAVNGCFTTTYTLNQIVVRIKPTADFTAQPNPACDGMPVRFTNNTTAGYSGTACLQTTAYIWDLGDGTPVVTGFTPPDHIYPGPGTYTVTLTATNTGCGADSKQKTVTVLAISPPPVAPPVTYCQYQQSVPLTATGTNLLWYLYPTGGTGVPTAPTPPTNTPGTFTYYVTQTQPNLCESPRTAVTVTVNAQPAAPTVTTPVNLCLNQPAGPLTATGTGLLWYTDPTGGIALPSAPVPSTAALGHMFYYVSQTINNCEGPRATIEVIVNPLPTAPAVTSPVIYCQDQAASALTATGTNLLWYTLATGGTGSPIAPVPATNTPGITTYYVTQSTICGESPRSAITVTVNPKPAANIAYTPSNLCNNTVAGNVPVQVTLTGTPGGAYSIFPTTGLSMDATGTITPAGATPGTYTIYYNIAASAPCAAFTTSTTVTISAMPGATISYPAICSSYGPVAVLLTGTKGGVFSSTAGLTIDAASGTITPATSTPGQYKVTYTIAASGPCPGFTATADVTITKAPNAAIAYNPGVLCNAAETPTYNNPPVDVTLTGTPGGTFSISSAGLPMDNNGTITPAGAIAGNYTITYSVTGTGGCANFSTNTTVTINAASSAAISYPQMCTSNGPIAVLITGTMGGTFSSSAGLTINQATGTIIPATSTPGNYTVTYTIPTAGPCPGFVTKTDITITKAPTAAITYNPAVLCNVNTPATNPPVAVTLTGTPGGIYTISPASGLPIDNNGTITPAGASPATYTITYKIPGSGGCADFSTTTSVTINPASNAVISYPLMCTSNGPIAVQLTGTQGGTYSSSSAGLTINATTGTITPATSTPGNYTITYTIPTTGPCPAFTTNTQVTIVKAPTAAIAYTPNILCNTNLPTFNNPPVHVTLTGDGGGHYSISPATGLQMEDDGTITPAGATPATYTITYSIPAANACSIVTASTTVTINPTPRASINYPPICSSDGIVNVLFNGTTGGTFKSTAGLSIDGSTGSITPTTSTPGVYKVTYTIDESKPCPGFDTSTEVVITKAPNASITYTPSSLCNVANTTATPNPPIQAVITGDMNGAFAIAPLTGLPIAANGTITPAGAIPGIYTINYKITGTGGCKDFNTQATINISPALIATISYPESPFCGSTNTPQPVTRTGDQGGVFSSTTGLSINAATGAINPSASKPGTYVVTYTIAPSAPCPGFTTNTSIVINESPVISFAVSEQAICSGGTATFKPASTVANTTYAWAVKGNLPAGVSGTTSGNAADPNATITLSFLNTTTIRQTIHIQVVPTNPMQKPCSGAPYDLVLNVDPVPPVLSGDIATACMHTPAITLTANPLPGNTVKWYDNNLVPLNAAPVVDTKKPLQYTYYASQVNGFGCESPKAKYIAVIHPTAQIVSSSYVNPTTCGIPSGSISLNVLDLNGDPMPNIPATVHYNKFQVAYAVNTNTNASGKITIPLAAGTYTDIYVETYGCTSQKLPDVFILKDPSPPAQPIAGYNAPLCTGGILNLSASSPTGGQGGSIDYVWVGPAIGNSPDTSRNTTVSIPNATTAYNGLYIVYTMQNNCISTPASFLVDIKNGPTKPVISTRTPLCEGDNLTLQATSTIQGNYVLNYVWTGPGLTTPVNAPYAAINNIKIPQGGIYTVTVTSTQTNCSATSDTLIQVGGYPIVKFPQDTLTLPTGYILQLTTSILNANDPNILPITKYAWTPSQGIQCNDAACSLPSATIKNNVCYSVKATNMYGCSGSDTMCVNVFCQNSQVFIANAFTPHGNIPENTRFMVKGTGIVSVKSFRVFNRWGRLVFERSNFRPNDPQFGWDGTFNGKPADTGVYVYTAEVICENGTPYQFKGNVTLFNN